MDNKEEWRDIPGFPGYDVSNCGRVRSYYKKIGKHTWEISNKPQRLMRPGEQTNGYFQVTLKINNRKTSRTVHRLVLETFIGSCPAGLEACHNDNDKQNNNLSNLRYDTHANNMRDRLNPDYLRKQYRQFVEEYKSKHAGWQATIRGEE